MIALLAGASVFLLTVAVRRPALTSVVGRYSGAPGPLRGGLRDRRWRPSPHAIVGGAVGAALVPGSGWLGAVLGGSLGFVVGSTRDSSVRRHRGRRLGQELQTVADMCALYVLSGDSVTGAMRRFVAESRGVAASEMADILERVDGGVGFPEAAHQVARTSAHRDGARLYELLAQAHRSGARLVDSLEMYAADRRAALERDMTAEGGRRALTGYGPILGLMVPTTLVFLMYPTLAGLKALSTTR